MSVDTVTVSASIEETRDAALFRAPR